MTTSPAELVEAKKAMRARVLAARNLIEPAQRRAASEIIAQRVHDLTIYRHAASVLTYMSFGTELETHGFFDSVLRDGKTAVLPRIDKTSKSLTLHAVRNHADLVDGFWGIREPHPDTPTVSIDTIDLVLMPGLAFDRTGRRLGYGAGYYDRLLATTMRPVRIAATFDCQVVEAVPVGPSDQPFHILVTESQLLHILL